jgi:hypothetical protein
LSSESGNVVSEARKMIGSVLVFVKGHPYLFANLPLLAAVLLLPRLTPNRDYWRAGVLGGLACTPFSLAELTARGYWRPVLLGGMGFGVEDLIFTYTAGAAAWLAAAYWSRETCVASVCELRIAILRMMPWAIPTTAVGLGLGWAGMDHITSTLIPAAGCLLFLLCRRASLWRLALAGVISFTPLYVLTVKLQFAAWPMYISYWNADGPWGTLALGLPRGEIAWAAMLGALWPVVTASALDIRFDRQ